MAAVGDVVAGDDQGGQIEELELGEIVKGPRARDLVQGLRDGAEVAVSDPATVGERWEGVLGAEPASAGVELRADPDEPGLTTIKLGSMGAREPLEIGGVRFEFEAGR